MGIKDFKLKWAHGKCREKPMYISDRKILVLCDFFMKTLDISGTSLRYHFEPGIRINCCSALPELGVVAVSERKVNGAIFILKYPKMTVISSLEQENGEMYFALEFMGLEFLISVQFRNELEIHLWKWSSGESVHSISVPLSNSEIPTIVLCSNPLWWHQVLVQSNERLMLLEINHLNDKYYLDATSYLFFEDKNGEIVLSTQNHRDGKNFQTDIINPQMKILKILCACWLPENNILVATSHGIFRLQCENFTIQTLSLKRGVSSMTLSKSCLFVAYKTGFVEAVNITGHHWNVAETFKVAQPIINTFMSPDYNFLTIVTVKGSILLRDLNSDKINVKTLLQAEFSEDVGVRFVGPFAKYCVVAKKNGWLKIFKTDDGSIFATFQLDEEISTITTSPACCCVIVGSNTGFLYFIDVSDPQKPRVVNCERPYDIPIDHLKFDNFGKFLVSSAQNQPIKIWNGLPSSGFVSLGSVTMSSQVNDFAVFNKTINDETILLILTQSRSGSDKSSGNILIRLLLPNDLHLYPKKYQTNLFGTLSCNSLRFEKRILNSSFCKVNIHCNLGIILYSSTAQKIKRYPLWSNFSNGKLADLLSIKNVSYISIAPNQRWIAATDFFGCVQVYDSKDLLSSTSSEKYTVSENINKYFLDLSLSSNNLVCTQEKGTILFYEWEEDLSCLHELPEWVVHCFLQFSKENAFLSSMEVEEGVALFPPSTEVKFCREIILSGIYKEFEVWICIISYKLDMLISVKESDLKDEINPRNFALDRESLTELSLENRRKLSIVTSENISKVSKNGKETEKESDIKTLSSINLGLVTQNYSKKAILKDIKQIENLSFHLDNKEISKKSCNKCLSFNKSVKLKSKKERLCTILDLLTETCSLKTEFNEEFEILFKKKPSIVDSFEEAYSKAKRLSHTLPSKAEKDFWNAIVEQDYKHSNDSECEHKDTTNKNTNTIEKAKSSIESYVKSAQDIQDLFDSDIEILLLKKRYCDYKIFTFEVKIYIILFFIVVENELSNWREETEKLIDDSEKVRNEIDGLLKEFSDLEKSIKASYLEFQKLERNSSSKIKSKYSSLTKSKTNLPLLKKHLPMKLDDISQNPFWSSSLSISADDLISVSKEFHSRNICPDRIAKSEWESICNKQTRVLKAGIVMRNFQDQLLFTTSAHQACSDAFLNLKVNVEIKQKALGDMCGLISKFTITFHYLMEALLEDTDLKIGGDTNTETEISSLRSIHTSDKKIWKAIDREAHRIQLTNLHLNEIEGLFECLNKIKLNMHSKIRYAISEYPDFTKDFKEQLEESKQHFSKTKYVAEEFIDGRKKNVFGILKSRISNDSVTLKQTN